MTGTSPSLQLAAAICAPATCFRGLVACDFQQNTAQTQQPLKPTTQAHKLLHVLQRHADGVAHKYHDWL